MGSPFPGMDPYLEAHWGDVHTSLCTYARDHLRPQLPGDLRARVEEYVAVESDEADEESGFYPDVGVVERPQASSPAAAAGSVGIAAQPLIVPMHPGPETLREVLIVDRRAGGRVVTAIEFLSPSNKLNAAGRRGYRRKQREFLDAGVNLVEVDLLRAGPYVLAVPVSNLPDEYRWPYRISVVRASRPEQAEVYRLSLREPLPAIRVPLRESDSDAHLDLQTLVAQAYENGGYEDTDYRADPVPPLADEDARWADELLRERGLR